MPSDRDGSSSFSSSTSEYFVSAQPERPDDPFERFWDEVEGMVQNMAGPVAFTSAPLPNQRPHTVHGTLQSCGDEGSLLIIRSRYFTFLWIFHSFIHMANIFVDMIAY